MAEVAVVGAGPAGIAAAIQLARHGHAVTVFEKGRIGGALWNASLVENYPGFPGGITGRHLARLMAQHLQEYATEILSLGVEKVEPADGGFLVDGRRFDGVAVCTGTRPDRANFDGEEELEGAGVLRYGIAGMDDWHELRNACVIGGGEASMDMALGLAETGIRVTLLHRSPLRGNMALLGALRSEDHVRTLEGRVSGARVHGGRAVLSLGDGEMAFDLVIAAVGRHAALPELPGTDPDAPPPGMFIAGDARRGCLGQAAMAAGDGLEAAAAMDRYLGHGDEGDR